MALPGGTAQAKMIASGFIGLILTLAAACFAKADPYTDFQNYCRQYYDPSSRSGGYHDPTLQQYFGNQNTSQNWTY
jgi:hypothetical protein